jgi:hypothetical protein
MLSFLKDVLAPRIGSIGCESAPLEVLECLQRAARGELSCAKHVAAVMAEEVLPGCGKVAVHVQSSTCLQGTVCLLRCGCVLHQSA